MKKKLSLLIALSALTLSVGAAVGVVVGVKGAKEAKATGPLNSGDVVYLEPGLWTKDSPRYALYYFDSANNNNNGWVDMVDMGAKGTISAGTFYYATIPSGYDTIIFCRMNPATTVNNWDNKYNQTGNLTISDATSNTYKMTDWGSGEWEKFSLNHEGEDRSLTFYAGSPDGYAPDIHAFGASTTTNTGVWPGQPMTKSARDDINFLGRELYRFTIEYKVYASDEHDLEVKMVISGHFGDNKTPDITVVADGGYYFPGGDTGMSWPNYTQDSTKGAAAAVAFAVSDATLCSTVDTPVANKLVEGLETHVENLSSTVWTNRTSEKATNYNEALKWIDKFTTSPSHQEMPLLLVSTAEASNYTAVIILASTLALIAVGGYFLLRKARKED